MLIESTSIPDVKILTPKFFEDDRGGFFESYNRRQFDGLLGHPVHFVQDNHSISKKNVLRGLHLQLHHPQGKLVRAIVGKIYDVVVDLRPKSPSFKQWLGITLMAEQHKLLWIPPGFAHGFLVLSEVAEVCYKTTDYYQPSDERTLRWDDPELAISWPLECDAILSLKDRHGLLLEQLLSSLRHI